MKTSQYYLNLIVLFSFFGYKLKIVQLLQIYFLFGRRSGFVRLWNIWKSKSTYTAVDALAKEGMPSQIFTLHKPFVRQVALKFTGMHPLKWLHGQSSAC